MMDLSKSMEIPPPDPPSVPTAAEEFVDFEAYGEPEEVPVLVEAPRPYVLSDPNVPELGWATWWTQILASSAAYFWIISAIGTAWGFLIGFLMMSGHSRYSGTEFAAARTKLITDCGLITLAIVALALFAVLFLGHPPFSKAKVVQAGLVFGPLLWATIVMGVCLTAAMKYAGPDMVGILVGTEIYPSMALAVIGLTMLAVSHWWAD